jgi:sugar phosphate isomerase/epimerase
VDRDYHGPGTGGQAGEPRPPGGTPRAADSHGRWEEHSKPGEGTIDFPRLFGRPERAGYPGHYMMAFGSLDDMLSVRQRLVRAAASGV